MSDDVISFAEPPAWMFYDVFIRDDLMGLEELTKCQRFAIQCTFLM